MSPQLSSPKHPTISPLHAVVIFFLFLSLLSLSIMHQRNRNTQLRLEIPRLQAEQERAREECEELEQLIDAFESPQNLLQLWLSPQFAHLRPLLPEQIHHELKAAPIKEEPIQRAEKKR